MEDERKRVAANPEHRLTPGDATDITVKYEVATMDRSPATGTQNALADDTASSDAGPHGEVRQGEHVESGAPGAEASFLGLADVNPAHFSPDNIARNWIPKHQLAMDLARKAWQARNPGTVPAPMTGGRHEAAGAGSGTGSAAAASAGLPPTTAAAAAVASNRPDPARTVTPAGLVSADLSAPPAEQAEAQAWLAAAFSDHFLTDAFAAGHLVTGDRATYEAFLRANANAVAAACAACAAIDSFFIAGPAPSWLVFRGVLAAKGPSLLLKTVHDYYNSRGIQVRNALGQTWRTYGDSHLGGSPDTQAMGKLAVKASRDAVQDVLGTGGTARAQAALDYIPAQASLDGVTFRPVADFAADPAVRTPVLSLSLSLHPHTNLLYQLIKGNVAFLTELKAAQTAHQAGKWVRGTASKAAETAHEATELPGRLEREIKRLYGVSQ